VALEDEVLGPVQLDERMRRGPSVVRHFALLVAGPLSEPLVVTPYQGFAPFGNRATVMMKA
jgi:hypothetical protein